MLFLLEERLSLRYAFLKRDLEAMRGQEYADPSIDSKVKEFENLSRKAIDAARIIEGGFLADENNMKKQRMLKLIQEL